MGDFNTFPDLRQFLDDQVLTNLIKNLTCFQSEKESATEGILVSNKKPFSKNTFYLLTLWRFVSTKCSYIFKQNCSFRCNFVSVCMTFTGHKLHKLCDHLIYTMLKRKYDSFKP